MSKQTVSATKKPLYKRWWFWLGIVVIVGIIGSQAGKKESPANSTPGSTERPSAAKKPKETPVLAVTATEYFEAYESNEVSADAKYKGKAIAITGEVDGVSKTFGIVSVNLKADKYIKEVQCKLKSEADAASIAKGQTVTLVGTGDGKTVYPEVENCVVRK